MLPDYMKESSKDVKLVVKPEKAAMFVDNSNIFQGMISFSKHMKRRGILGQESNLKIRWDKILAMLENQDNGMDIFSRHFFASLPPASWVNALRQRPTDEEWDEMVRTSAHEGFFRAIQHPPFSFELHGIPLKLDETPCGNLMQQAWYKCRKAFNGGDPECDCVINVDACRACDRTVLSSHEKGVDVGLATQMLLSVMRPNVRVDRVILVAGDGDYSIPARFIRNDLGIDLQIVSWRYALSNELDAAGNKPTIYLEDHWRDLCDRVDRPGFEEFVPEETAD